MKNYLLPLLITISASATAQELSFGDQNYFLKAGQVNFSLDGARSVIKEKRDPGLSGTSKTYTQDGYIFNSKLAYALTDRFNAFVGLNYQYEMAGKISGADVDYYSDGFENPALGANLRLLNQSEALVNLDYGFVTRQKVQDSKSGDVSGGDKKRGNPVDPRNSYELNARVGRKWNEANEWQVGAGLIYHTEGKYTQKVATGSSNKMVLNSSVDTFARVNYQYRPVKEFMMNLGWQTTRVEQTTGKNKDTATKTRTSSHYDHDLTFVAKYLILENFIAKFNYSQGINPAYNSSVSGNDDKIKNRRESIYGFGVDFLF